MSDEATQTNTPEARTETGELKGNLSATQTQSTDTSSTTTTETKPDAKTDTTEAKGGDDKSLMNQGKDEGKKEAPTGAPETYSDFKAPEGFEIDKDAIAEAIPVLKELNLSQEQAQKAVDLYAKISQKASEAPLKYFQEKQQEWINQVKADPEIGGKLDQVRGTVARAVDALGDPKLAADFKEAMDYTGAGNNPAFIRVLYKLASQVTEGTPVRGNGPSKFGQGSEGDRPRSVANALFPHLP